MKQLETMTRKQIESYLKENNIRIDKAYKMTKSQLITAVENGIKNEKLFNPDKVYIFSKEKYLNHIDPNILKNVLRDEEIMDWLDRIDGEEVKQNHTCRNTVYVEDQEFETFRRCFCVEVSEEYTCKLNLGDLVEVTDEDETYWEYPIAECVESDISYYEGMIEEIENNYGDQLDHLEDYRYTISHLRENDIEFLEKLFSNTEGNLNYCYVKYDFINNGEGG